jgi:hypothetical protein
VNGAVRDVVTVCSNRDERLSTSDWYLLNTDDIVGHQFVCTFKKFIHEKLAAERRIEVFGHLQQSHALIQCKNAKMSKVNIFMELA